MPSITVTAAITAAITAAMLGGSEAHAQLVEEDWDDSYYPYSREGVYVGLEVLYALENFDRDAAVETTGPNVDGDDTGGFGLRLGYRFHQRFSGELLFQYYADFNISTHVRSMVAATVLGAREDLNRLGIESDVDGIDLVMPAGSAVVDRTQPVGLVRAGVRAVELWDDRFDIAAYVENALDARPQVPDLDFEKQRAVFPVPMPGRSVMLTITGKL